ncbi:MAG: hypothetical protein RR540_00825 [Oscillospiraceae bacterium]
MTPGIIFPLPLPIHIIFCVISLVFFIIQYMRKKNAYLLLLAIAIPSTLLIYVCKTNLMYGLLGIEEFVLLVLIIIGIARSKKKTDKNTAEKVLIETETSDENIDEK